MAKQKLNPVLILGGGPAGMAAATELADQGVESVIVEQAPDLGGLAVKMACKATDECARCGVCLADDLRAKTSQSDLIQVLTQTTLQSFSRDNGSFKAVLKGTSGKEEKRPVKCRLIAAVGASPIDPAIKSQFGYGILENVISGLELEEMVRTTQAVKRPSDGARPKRVGFVQCVGSRDVSVGGEARAGSRAVPGSAAATPPGWRGGSRPTSPAQRLRYTIWTSSPSAADPAGLLAKIKDKAEFVRAIPGQVEQNQDKGLKLRFKPEYEPGLEEREVDLLVLSIGLTGPKMEQALARMIGVRERQGRLFGRTRPGTGGRGRSRKRPHGHSRGRPPG